MSSSVQRRVANRANARQSAGPRTREGKEISSGNAIRHGLLSTRLILDDEDPDVFVDLLSDLQGSLAPVGTMELSLVERIAVALWRQRRLVTAESASLDLARQPRQIAMGVSAELGLRYSSELREDDLQPFDPDSIAWCAAALAEIEALEQIDLASLPELAPRVFAQLAKDGEDEGIEPFLAGYEKGLTGYVDQLMAWCREQLRESERRPHVQALATQVRAKRLILPDDTLQIIARYQTMLDNQLYKALKALREAQEWRLRTLEGQALGSRDAEAEAPGSVIGFVSQNA